MNIDTLSNIVSNNMGGTQNNETFNYWALIAILELLFIILIAFRNFAKNNGNEKQKMKRESLSETIDFANIINSSFNSVKLYDELKVKCHPDRFPNDPEKISIAEDLFQEISKNKKNVKRLLEIKDTAIERLNINFKK